METNETGGSQGVPSAGLNKLRMDAAINEAREGQGGLLEVEDQDEGFDNITDAVPEKGIFTLVGGYVDTKGEKPELFNKVHLRAMGGYEEDLLGNDAVTIVQRMDGIMASCTEKIECEESARTVTDPGEIARMIRLMPTGTRTHLLISMRRTTHWRKTKDNYDMVVRCPRCRKERSFTINLGDLEVFHSPKPLAKTHNWHLVECDIDVKWRIASGVEDEVLAIAGRLSEHESLSYMILMRIIEWDGEDVRLGISDVLDTNRKKIKLSPRAKRLMTAVKKLSSGDREDMREQILEYEPGVDVDLEFECDKAGCKIEYTGTLDVGQKTFFFPSATSRRLRRKSST
jgi:hypothetical protein